MKLSLNQQVFLGAAAGVGMGILLNVLGPEHPFTSPVLYTAGIIGGLFLSLLKMILIPLVFTSIAVGIANLRAHAQMDKVWKYALGYFVCTTALAVLLGLVVVNVFKPGAGLKIEMFHEAMQGFSYHSISMGGFVESFVSGLFLNPVKAMAAGSVLPTIIFAMFLGIALVVAGDRGKTVLHFLNEFFELIMLIVGWIMAILPIGLAALLAKLLASQNVETLLALGKFMAVVIGATLFHGIVVLPFLLMAVTGVSPIKFFKAMQEALITAFSTSSSSATLPVTMRYVEDELKVDKDVAGFVLPLGATINMDGTALYEAVAAIFVANLAGIDLNLAQQLVVFLTAIIAAMGAPGIPSAGMVTMIMVLQSVGLPVEAIAILLPIDRILDAIRTAVNVEGDAVGSRIVDHLVSSFPNSKKEIH